MLGGAVRRPGQGRTPKIVLRNNRTECCVGSKKTGKGRRKLGRKKRRMRSKIRHRKGSGPAGLKFRSLRALCPRRHARPASSPPTRARPSTRRDIVPPAANFELDFRWDAARRPPAARQAALPRQAMNDPTATLDRLAANAEQLYSLPAVAMEVLHLTDNPQVDTRALKECIENDPALTGKILRVVNSSLFGLSREVSDLNQALTLLGTKPLKLLVLGFSLPSGLYAGIEARTLGRYWRRTLTKAVAGRELAERLWHVPGDDAFIAGLLQDVGILLLLQQLGQPYCSSSTACGARALELDALEAEAMGFTHTALSAKMLARWHLPQNLVEAVAADPQRPAADARPGDPRLAANPPPCRVDRPAAGRRPDQRVGAAAGRGPRLSQSPGRRIAGPAERLGREGPPACLGALAAIARGRPIRGHPGRGPAATGRRRPRGGGGVAPRLTRRGAPAAARAVARGTGGLGGGDFGGRRSAPCGRNPCPTCHPTQPHQRPNCRRQRRQRRNGGRHPTATTAASAAMTDPGLLGRLGLAVTACRQSRSPLSLLLVELDHTDELLLVLGVEGFDALRRLLESACGRLDHPGAM